MHTCTIRIPSKSGKSKERDFPFASKWEELDTRLLGRASLLLAADITEEQKRAALLALLAGIPKEHQHLVTNDDLLFHMPQYDEGGLFTHHAWKMLPQLDWAFQPPVFTKSLLPTIDVGKAQWIGPGNDLLNFKFLQWQMTDHCLRALSKQPSDTALNNLLGALYRPPGTAWTKDSIEERGAILAKLPGYLRAAAVFNYKALRARLPILYRLTFTPKDGGRDWGVRGALIDAAGEKFGKPNEVAEEDLHNVLTWFEMQCTEAERIKKDNQGGNLL